MGGARSRPVGPGRCGSPQRFRRTSRPSTSWSLPGITIGKPKPQPTAHPLRRSGVMGLPLTTGLRMTA
jgi:hypothetical protein